MQFGSTTIATPLEDSAQFDPEWRNAFALAWVDDPAAKLDPEFASFKRDPWIREQVAYIRAVRGGHTLTKEQRLYRQAANWYQGSRTTDVKFKIEPLLLTPASFDTIALDIGGGMIEPQAFKIYERLYFNARTADWKMSDACQLRTYLASPNGIIDKDSQPEAVWKMIAANNGYDAIVSMWMWGDAHGLSDSNPSYIFQKLHQQVQGQLWESVYRGNVSNFDKVALYGKMVDRERMERETKAGNIVGLEGLQAMQTFLGYTQPQLILAAKTVDQCAETTAAVRDRLLQQRSLGSQDVVDHGVDKGIEGLNGMIASGFKQKRGKE